MPGRRTVRQVAPYVFVVDAPKRKPARRPRQPFGLAMTEQGWALTREGYDAFLAAKRAAKRSGR